MASTPTLHFRKCFIAAAPGLRLGRLPAVLSERSISWEWGKEYPGLYSNPLDALRSSDFVIAIIDSSYGSRTVFFYIGVAIGLRKPVFLISRTRRHTLELDRLSSAFIPLNDQKALSFHLDLFLRTPQKDLLSHDLPPATTDSEYQHSVPHWLEAQTKIHSQLEQGVERIITSSGGSVIAQPPGPAGNGYRPDFLAWLGHIDPELLNPTIIETKDSVTANVGKRIERQLLAYLASTGIKSAFVLTNRDPPELSSSASPYIFWLSLTLFQELIQRKQLGAYIRDLRNRAMHGSR